MKSECEIAEKLAEEYKVENPMKQLKQIALELLEKYEALERNLIFNSVFIDHEGIENKIILLNVTTAYYKKRIEVLTK